MQEQHMNGLQNKVADIAESAASEPSSGRSTRQGILDTFKAAIEGGEVLELKPDEVHLLAAFRKWKTTAAFASQVFHYRHRTK